MKVQTKKTYQHTREYVLNCIDPDVYGVVCSNDRELLLFLLDYFKKEFWFENNKLRYKSVQRGLAEYFMGLPSVFNCAFTNYDILQLAKEWGSLPDNPTEREENKILENYWMYLANAVLVLCNKNKINWMELC